MTETECEDFKEFVRNGLMHDAETRKGWLVEKTIPKRGIVDKNKRGEYRINRTKFHSALKGAFEDWLAKLRNGDAALRKKMRDRMDQIIATHYKK